LMCRTRATSISELPAPTPSNTHSVFCSSSSPESSSFGLSSQLHNFFFCESSLPVLSKFG
jgi:hypothetical protein